MCNYSGGGGCKLGNMEEKLVIAGVEIPREDWEKTPASVKELILHLEQRLTTIEERLGLNSQNSSQPPSFDPPGQKKTNMGQRKRGAQKGHLGFGRYLYDHSECSEVVEHKPEHCQYGPSSLNGVDPNPYRHQIVEIPPVQLEIVEHRLHALDCPNCGRKTRGSLPEGVNPSGYGERLQGIVALLSGAYRLSHENVKNLMEELWGVRISIGSLNRIRQKVTQQLAESVSEAISHVQKSAVAYVDETSWKQHDGDGSNPERKSSWLWVAACGLVTVYRVTLNRAGCSAQELLGPTYGGLVVSDRYSAYNWLDLNQRQLCWAHLKRDFTRMSERSGVAGEIGQALLRQTQRLFRWWHRVRDGTLSWELFEMAMTRLRTSVHRLLSEAADLCEHRQEKTPLAKTARTCAMILKLESALWTFVDCPGIEPTNNTAERALRTAVIWRRLSFGSQSAGGSEFVARMLTVVTTLRTQGRSILDFLIQVLRCEATSLLPLPNDIEFEPG